MNEPLDKEVEASIATGMALFNNEEFFEAHEVWEETWSDSQENDRHLLQGLIQVAAAFYKLQIGMPSGTAKLLEKSLAHLTVVPENFYDLDLEPLVESVEVWRDTAKEMVEQWRTDFDKDALPQLHYVKH